MSALNAKVSAIAQWIKSADLACEFHGVISEPGAKTLAWPRGRRGGSAREVGRGGGGGGRGSMLFYSGVLGGLDSPLKPHLFASGCF